MDLERSRPLDRPQSIERLLEIAGARIRNNKRADCPECHTRSGVSYDAERGLFKCHGWSKETQRYCDFRGNAWMLKKRLGMAERLTPKSCARLIRNAERGSSTGR